ncbi:MAG: patatin-like phospholipase family protein [Casimicrobiaceae bacterium]|nr:patatin-like phospholipase family protein [Casimicrobiaceae bacterium]
MVETVIRASFGQPGTRSALVLMGGGARAAYQAGVLAELARVLRSQGRDPSRFPFDILVGTSAGAINVAFLASHAQFGLDAFDALVGYWEQVRCEQVFTLRPVGSWFEQLAGTRLGAAWYSLRAAREYGALVDSAPLRQRLEAHIGFASIVANLASGLLQAVAVTAFSYTSGTHWTFCSVAGEQAGAQTVLWSRPGRVAVRTRLGADHLMASSAIPLVFPPVALEVAGHVEFFGDGAMRQTSPLSPALKLGADRILIVGVSQPPGVAQRSDRGDPARSPGPGEIAANVISSVFHDTLAADVEQTQRISDSLARMPREVAQTLGYRPVCVAAIYPRGAIDRMAQSCWTALPRPIRQALAPWLAEEGASALASYLLFEAAFARELVRAGREDLRVHLREANTWLGGAW